VNVAAAFAQQSRPWTQRITVAKIQAAVADYYGIAHSSMREHDPRPEVSHKRQVAMYLACELTGQTLSSIAQKFDRDHSTVIYARREVEQRMKSDLRLAHDVELLREGLSG
jgi:chromosomal replication initiator protein